jgi:hypothetical protein
VSWSQAFYVRVLLLWLTIAIWQNWMLMGKKIVAGLVDAFAYRRQPTRCPFGPGLNSGKVAQ